MDGLINTKIVESTYGVKTELIKRKLKIKTFVGKEFVEEKELQNFLINEGYYVLISKKPDFVTVSYSAYRRHTKNGEFKFEYRTFRKSNKYNYAHIKDFEKIKEYYKEFEEYMPFSRAEEFAGISRTMSKKIIDENLVRHRIKSGQHFVHIKDIQELSNEIIGKLERYEKATILCQEYDITDHTLIKIIKDLSIDTSVIKGIKYVDKSYFVEATKEFLFKKNTGYIISSELYKYDIKSVKTITYNKNNRGLFTNSFFCKYRDMWVVSINDIEEYFKDKEENKIEKNVSKYFEKRFQLEIVQHKGYKQCPKTIEFLREEVKNLLLETEAQEDNQRDIVSRNLLLACILAENLEKELNEYSSEEMNKVIDIFSDKYVFIDFTIFYNKYFRKNGEEDLNITVQSKKSKQKICYKAEVMGEILSIGKNVEENLKYGIIYDWYAQIWLYICISYMGVWRKTDIISIKKIEFHKLGIDHRDFLRGIRLKDYEIERFMGYFTKKEYMINKTRFYHKLFTNNQLHESFATAMALCIYHSDKEKKDELFYKLKKTNFSKKMKSFLEMNKASISSINNIKFSNSMMSYFFKEFSITDMKNVFKDTMSLRGHKKESSTVIYLNTDVSQEEIDFISNLLFDENNHFGWMHDILLQMSVKEEYDYMNLEEKSKLINCLGKVIFPCEAEMLSKKTIEINQKATNLLCKLSRSELESIVFNLEAGLLCSKADGIMCPFNEYYCVEEPGMDCHLCKYAHVNLQSLMYYEKEIYSMIENYINDEGYFVEQRKHERLIQEIFLKVILLVNKFGIEKSKAWIDIQRIIELCNEYGIDINPRRLISK
jgi:hypothetical protein